MTDVQTKELKKLQNTVVYAIETIRNQKSDDKDTAEYIENTKAYLKNMKEELEKLSSLMRGERSPTVGVFGCPSRGKSTLLNVLMGVDILPMQGKPGTTRFGTTLSYKDIKKFQITRKYKTKNPTTEESDEEYVNWLLEDFARDADIENPDITSIEIEGPFRPLIGKEIKFIDTPGVELGSSEDDDPNGRNFEIDTQRALAVLSTVDVVVFCMILKYKEKKDADFYNKEIRNRYNAINVINAGDSRDDDDTDHIIKQKLHKDYKLHPGETVIVSSKQAIELIREAIKNKSDLIAILESDKFDGENLAAFRELKAKILERITSTADIINRRIATFKDLYTKLQEDAADKKIKLPKLDDLVLTGFGKLGLVVPPKVNEILNTGLSTVKETAKGLKDRIGDIGEGFRKK